MVAWSTSLSSSTWCGVIGVIDVGLSSSLSRWHSIVGVIKVGSSLSPWFHTPTSLKEGRGKRQGASIWHGVVGVVNVGSSLSSSTWRGIVLVRVGVAVVVVVVVNLVLDPTWLVSIRKGEERG